jgi:ribosomal protein L11 methyltransferase
MIRLAVRCRADQADAVLAELVQLAPNGVEEERSPNWVEYAVYGAPGEVPELGELRAAVADSEVEVLTSSIPDDWADRWADFHRPIVIADQIRVRPSWWKREGEPIDVVIDPGQAFGTGAHATTRLCLEVLVAVADRARPTASPSGAVPAPAGPSRGRERPLPDGAGLGPSGAVPAPAGPSRGRERPLPDGAGLGPLADWGTGSGVLAIVAAKLGWGPVIGCDRERAALDSARANAEANDVALELRRVDVRAEAPPSAPSVVANLTAPLLAECAGHLADGSEKPQALICSGMLAAEADGVAEAFGAAGLSERQRRRGGDWCALLLQRSAD